MLCYQDERLQGKEIWQLLTVSLQGMSWAGKCSNLHPQPSPRTSCQFFLQYSVQPLLILPPGNSLCSSQDLIPLPMSHRHQLRGSLTYNTHIPNSAQISSHQYPIASMEHPTCSHTCQQWEKHFLSRTSVSTSTPQPAGFTEYCYSVDMLLPDVSLTWGGNGHVYFPMHPHHPAPLSPTLTLHQHHITDFIAVTSDLHPTTEISPRPFLHCACCFRSLWHFFWEREGKKSPSLIKHLLCWAVLTASWIAKLF